MSHRPSISPYTDAICHMSGCFVTETKYKPIIRSYMPYVRMVWLKDPVSAHYTDAICHMSGWYGSKTLYQPMIRTLYAICQDGMSQRPCISPLYGRYMPYVRMLCSKDPVSAHYTDAICHMSGCFVTET